MCQTCLSSSILVRVAPLILGAPSSYVPDLLGCVATANTREELLEEIREAIEFHIESMLQDGESIPDPQATSEVVEVSVVAGT